MRFLTSAKAIIPYMRATGAIPSRASAFQEYEDPAPTKSLHYVVEAAEDALPNPIGLMVQTATVRPLIEQALNQSVRSDKVPVETALRKIADSVRAVYHQQEGE